MSEFQDRSAAPGGGHPGLKGGAGGRDAVEELVFLYLEEREQGLVKSYDEFARRHSSTSAVVRDRILALERAGLMGGDGPTPVPERMGPFRVLERLGGGGMGVVYAALDPGLGRRVALKLIRPEQLFVPQAKDRFRREVEAVARLSHPGIVQIYSFAEDGGVPFFAMELVEGASLGDVLKQFAGRSPSSLAGRDLGAAVTALCGKPCAAAPVFEGSWTRACLEIARQVAEALEHAHARGIVHRDVKPSNVMLTTDGRARLLDFGLASRTGASKLTNTGAQLGSMPYMPPEVISGRAGRGEDSAEIRGDVYSLGVSLVECLTLALPFQAEMAPLLAQKIAAGVHEPLSRRNPDVSIDVQTVCDVAMELDPARRYGSAAALAQDLSRVLERKPIAARPTGALLRARRWVERNPTGTAALVLGVLLFVGGPMGYAVLASRAADRERLLNTDLRAAKTELEARNADLATALAGEQQETARAERNFQRAFDAIDEMLVTVGSDDLREVPRFDPVRTQLLERALDFYGRLQLDDPTNLGVRREMARTARSMGDVLATLGREEDALAQYQLAVDRARALVGEGAADLDTRYVLASALGMVGARHLRADEHESARAALEESLATATPLAAAVPENLTYSHCLVSVTSNLGLVAFRQGEFDAAYEHFGQALEVARRAHAAAPQDTQMSEALASALSFAAICGKRLDRGQGTEALEAEAWNLLLEIVSGPNPSRSTREQFLENSVNYGLSLMTSDPAKAEHVLSSALERGRQLAAEFPEDPNARRGLVGLAANLGIQRINQGQFAAAEEALAVAIEHGELLFQSEPDNHEFPFLLCSALAARSATRLERRDLAGAGEDADRAVAMIEDVRRNLPNHPSVVASASACLLQRAEVELARNERSRAVETVQGALALNAVRVDVQFQAFETLWHCARHAAADASLEPDERTVERTEWVTQALDQLEAAIRAGFSDRARLDELPDYEDLRSDPRFRELAERVPPRER